MDGARSGGVGPPPSPCLVREIVVSGGDEGHVGCSHGRRGKIPLLKHLIKIKMKRVVGGHML